MEHRTNTLPPAESLVNTLATIKSSQQIYIESVENACVSQLLSVLHWFSRHCKNHSLYFETGMGSAFWVLDDTIIDLTDANGRPKTDRRSRLLTPLLDMVLLIESHNWFWNSIDMYHYHPQTGVSKGHPDLMGQFRLKPKWS